MELKISELNDPSRIPEIIELFRTGLGETTAEHWMWRLFTDNGQEDRPFAVIAENDKGVIVAMSSILAVEYGKGSDTYKCFQFCDWIVHPQYRGQGLIKKIYQYVYDYFENKSYDFIIEFPNDNSYPIFKKFNFSERENIYCWKTKSCLFFFKNHSDLPRIYNGTEIRFSDTCPFDSEVFISEGRIKRSAVYFQWKYDLNPDNKFYWVSIWRGQKCEGYFVYTITQGRIRSAVNIYDWEYNGQDRDVFRYVLRQLRRKGNYVCIWGKYSDEIYDFFKYSGLKRTKFGTRFVLKTMSSKGVPEPIFLTRIDTDY